MNYPNINEPLKKNGNDYWSTKKQLEAHFSWNGNIGKFELSKPFTPEQTKIIIDLLGNPEEAFNQKKECKQVNFDVFYNKLNTNEEIISRTRLSQKIKNEFDKKKRNDSKADTIIEDPISQKIKNESDKKKRNDSKADTTIEDPMTKLAKALDKWI